MLFYRARLDRPAAALQVSLSPVRPASPAAAAGLGGRVRVVARYGPASGPVGVHRGWLHTDLPPGRRLRLAGCQSDGDALLLSLGAVPMRAGRERLTDRFRLPFRLTAWGVEAVAGVRVELFCVPSVRPGVLLLRGRAVVVLETPADRLVRVVSFCRRLAVDLNLHLRWRARAAVEGLDVRVGPGGAVEGWLHVAVVCQGEPGRDDGGASGAALRDPAAVRRVDAAVARLDAEVIRDGLALVSGAVELDVAWADRSGRGRWTSREVPFSALMEIPGLCEGDRLKPVAQVERVNRVGAGADEWAFLLLGVGLTALRPVHREIGGAWYRMAQVVGQAVATAEVDEPLFPRGEPPAPADPWREVRPDHGLAGPWTALQARIRRAGGRAVLEVRGEPYGAGGAGAAAAGSGPAAARLELPGGMDAQVSLAGLGAQAELLVRRLAHGGPDGGVEVRLPRMAASGQWHALGEPARWVLDAVPCVGGLRCLVRKADGLSNIVLPVRQEACESAAADGGAPTAWTVAGTAVRGVGMDRLWVEVGEG